jgi:hypothetical protein
MQVQLALKLYFETHQLSMDTWMSSLHAATMYMCSMYSPNAAPLWLDWGCLTNYNRQTRANLLMSRNSRRKRRHDTRFGLQECRSVGIIMRRQIIDNSEALPAGHPKSNRNHKTAGCAWERKDTSVNMRVENKGHESFLTRGKSRHRIWIPVLGAQGLHKIQVKIKGTHISWVLAHNKSN